MKIDIIHPYKIGDTWFFDDEETGLVQEPFVRGTSEFVDTVLSTFGIVHWPFSVLFSDKNFGNGSGRWPIEIVKVREEDGGCWYKSETFNKEFWLCPQLFRYFDSPPERIYIRVIQ